MERSLQPRPSPRFPRLAEQTFQAAGGRFAPATRSRSAIVALWGAIACAALLGGEIAMASNVEAAMTPAMMWSPPRYTPLTWRHAADLLEWPPAQDFCLQSVRICARCDPTRPRELSARFPRKHPGSFVSNAKLTVQYAIEQHLIVNWFRQDFYIQSFFY